MIFLNEVFSTQCISITLMNDDISEPDETFTVTLMGIPDVTPPNVVFTSTTITVTVVDDDGGMQLKYPVAITIIIISVLIMLADKCLDGRSNCHGNADCTSGEAGSFTCSCKAGLSGDGIIECSGQLHS